MTAARRFATPLAIATGVTGAAGAYGFMVGRRHVFPASVADACMARWRRRRYRTGPWAITTSPCSDPLDLTAIARSARPSLSWRDVDDVDAAFVADPFLIAGAESVHMFFEIMNRASGRGEIGVATSDDGGATWVYGGVVLREPFHLSYPQVFRWCGRHYMVPETNEDRSVRLYAAHDFPGGWRHEATLLRGHRYVDASLFQHEGRWWMFISDALDPVLNLFWAEAPIGPWHAHPDNPIVADDGRCTRPAGRVHVHGGRVVRFAQDDRDSYGRAVHAFEVTRISPVAYAETELVGAPGLGPGQRPWNAAGMHHVDLLHHGGRWLAAVDGREF